MPAQAVRPGLRLNGRQVLLGIHGTPESWQKYRRTLAEWQANGCCLPEHTATAYTVERMCEEYLAHCRVYYRRLDGTATTETDRVELSFRELRRLYADMPAHLFGLAELKTVRHAMIEAGLARTNVNTHIGRVVRCFGWAAEEQRVPAQVFGALRALRRLRRGRSAAHETNPVRPVEWSDVEPVLEHVSTEVRAMILLQWHTGMRPGEVVQLRPVDIDRTGVVWIYRPPQHKLEHHGKERIVGIGPKGQEVLHRFLTRVPPPDPDAPLFAPRNAVAAQQARRRQNRRTPLWDAHRRRYVAQRAKRPKRVPGDSYDVSSYRRAIARGCRVAGIESWSPNRLRHAAATRLRRELGIEAARVVLGHASAATSEVYAEVDRVKAVEIMAALG